MAYRYLDGQGNEVLLRDGRALVHHIQLGDISHSTMILDEGLEEWVRAVQHPAYMELVEGASGDGTRLTEIAVGAPSTSSASFRQSDVDSSASPESVRATRPLSVDPASVASRSATLRPDRPNLRRVARRVVAWKRASWGAAVAFVAPCASLVLVLLLSGSTPWGPPVFDRALVGGPQSGDSPVGLGLGEPPAGVVAGLAESSRRYAARVAELQRELGLHSSPPAIWLDGAYLAQAGRYPEVLAYWNGLRALVQTVRREDMLIYRSGLEGYLREVRLVDSERADAWIWAVTAYDLRREPRRAVFEEFERLAAASTDLHTLLLKRGELIQYEPGEGNLPSRKPGLGIVTENQEVRDELDAAIDRVLETLARVHTLEPVSTDGLTRSLLDRLWATTVPVVIRTVVAVR